MPLKWTTIDLPWAGGIDDKRHPYLRELPRAESLLNFRLQQSGAWSARDGYTNLGGPAQRPDVAFRWGDVLAQTADETFLLDQPNGNWRQLGFTGPRAVGVAQRPILRTQEGASSVVCAVVNGHVLHAWTRSPLSAVHVLVRNLETGVVVYGPTTIAALDVAAPYAASLRAVAHENTYATVFASAGGASVNAVTFSIAATGTVTVGTASALTGTASAHYEVHANPNNSNVYLVTDNGNDLYLLRLTRSALTLSIQSSCMLTGATSITSPLGVVHNADSGRVYAFSTSAGGGGGNVLAWYETAATTLPASTALLWSRTPGITDPNTQTHFRAAPRANGTTCLLVEGTTNRSPNDLTAVPPGNIGPVAQPVGVWRIEIDGAGDETASGTTWNVSLASAPIEWNGHVHTWLLAPDAVQSESTQNTRAWPYGGGPTYPIQWSRAWASRRVGYVATAEAGTTGLRRVAEFGHDVVSFATPASPVVRGSSSSVPQAYVNGGEAVIPVASVELPSQVAATAGVFSNPSFRSLREYRFEPRHVATAEASELGILASGYVACLDGDRVGDVMQLPPPTWVDAWFPQSDSTGNDLDASWNCDFVAVWEWRDALGRLHRSAPSVPLPNAATEVTAIAGKFVFTNVSARVAIPPFIDWDTKAGCLPKDIYLAIYTSPGLRAVSTGALATPDGLFYATTPEYGVALASLREASYPWMSTRIGPGGQLPSSIFSIGRPLYTNGTPLVLENDPCINPLHMATTRDRVWVIDSENRSTVWFSKPILPNDLPPEFSANLTLSLPTEAGELVALGAVDDLVLFMSQSSVFGLDTAAAGPDSTGVGDFPPLRRISREVGCINAASVITTDVGCFFASAAGIYVVQSTGELTWVGRDLGDDVNVSSITSAHVVPERKEVIFTTPSGLLVYDYDHGAWTQIVWTATNRPTAGGATLVSSVVYGGETVVVATDGRAWQEDDTSEEGMICLARTGWIHLAGLQAFQRVRRFGLLGRVLFEPTPASPLPSGIDLGSFNIRVYYDFDDSDFDDYTVVLANVFDLLDPMRIRWHLTRQKSQALSFQIGFTPPVPGQLPYANPRPELVGLALEVGTKQRLAPYVHALGTSLS